MHKPIKKANLGHAKMHLFLELGTAFCWGAWSIKASSAVLTVSKLEVHNSALPSDCAGPAEAVLWPAALFCLSWYLLLAQWLQPELLKVHRIRILPAVFGKAEPDLSTELLLLPNRMKSKNWFFNWSIHFYSCDVYTFYMVNIFFFFFKSICVERLGGKLKISYLGAWKFCLFIHL